VRIQVSNRTTPKQYRELRRAVDAYFSCHNDMWQGEPVSGLFSIHDTHWTRYYVGASLRCSWQERRVWIAARSEALLFLSQSMREIGIEFELLPQRVELLNAGGGGGRAPPSSL
jgi:hypothetical protein